jgi:predicted ribosomally synthesized peptide with SipW-like signal peptide
MSRLRSVLASILVVGVVGLVAGAGTFAAFSATTGNTGNAFAAGTVVLADNDAGSAMWSVTNRIPGDSATTCIRLTYTGTLDATVKVYSASSVDTVDQYLTLTVEKGSMPGGTTFPNCTGFSSESTIYSGTVQGFKNSNNSYANGVAANPGAQTKWIQNDTLVYRFTVTLQNNTGAQGLTSTTGFTWEARNQ